MLKKIISIMISLSMLASASAAWAAPLEDAGGEPQIELMAETQIFDGGSGTEEDPYLISTAAQLRLLHDFPSCSFMLLNDIELTGWNYVGYAGANFSGVFDGAYHTISGLTQRFVDINNGTIKNTNFVGTDSMVAKTNNGSIENCTSESSVSGSYYSYDYAGFVGYNNGTINQCIYRGSVKASNTGSC